MHIIVVDLCELNVVVMQTVSYVLLKKKKIKFDAQVGGHSFTCVSFKLLKKFHI